MDPQAITADHLGHLITLTSGEGDEHSVTGTLARVTHYIESNGDRVLTKLTILSVGGLVDVETGRGGRGDRFRISISG